LKTGTYRQASQPKVSFRCPDAANDESYGSVARPYNLLHERI